MFANVDAVVDAAAVSVLAYPDVAVGGADAVCAVLTVASDVIR